MKKNLFIPIATCFILFFMTACEKFKVVQIAPDDYVAVIEFSAAKAGETYSKEATTANAVKKTLDSKKIASSNVNSVKLTKATAQIEANSTLDFADIESITVVVNGVEWAKLPVNASGKTVELIVSNADIKSTVIDADSIRYVYTTKAKNTLPATTITFTMKTLVGYEVF